MEQLTLSYLLTDNEICLGYKKRGFGAGNWNGFGGKLNAGEGVYEAACRELQEEARVHVHTKDLEPVAAIEFIFADGMHLEVHAFFVRTWAGEPQETEEMRPRWFSFDEIPYSEMWADDEHWLPRALSGEKLTGMVWFAENGVDIKTMTWKPVDSFV